MAKATKRRPGRARQVLLPPERIAAFKAILAIGLFSLNRNGREILDDVSQLATVGLQRATGVTHGQGQAPEFGLPHRLLPIGVSRQAPTGQRGQTSLGKRAAGQLVVGVLATAQQRAQAVGLRGAARGEVMAGTEQDPCRVKSSASGSPRLT